MKIIFLPNNIKKLLEDNQVVLKRLTLEKLKTLLPGDTFFEIEQLTQQLREKNNLLDVMGLGFDDKFYKNDVLYTSPSSLDSEGTQSARIYKLADSVLNGVCCAKELFILWLEKPNYTVNNCMVGESGKNLITALSAVLTLQEVEDTKIFENFFLKGNIT